MNTIYPRNDFKKCVLLTNCWKQNVHLQWIYLKLYNEKKRKKKRKKKHPSGLRSILYHPVIVQQPWFPSHHRYNSVNLWHWFRFILERKKKMKNVNFSGMYVSSVQGPPLYTFVYLFIFSHLIPSLFNFSISIFFPKTIFKSIFWFTLTWRSVVTWSILKSKFHLDQYIETYRQNIEVQWTILIPFSHWLFKFCLQFILKCSRMNYSNSHQLPRQKRPQMMA